MPSVLVDEQDVETIFHDLTVRSLRRRTTGSLDSGDPPLDVETPSAVVIYVSDMPTVHVSEHSDLPPEVVLTAARDFTERRAEMWPDVHVEYLEVHEVGESHAEVTEGNPWPIGYVWERLRYDWSDIHSLRGVVIDSNLFKPGSTWELSATPEDGGSRVEIRAVRHLRGRGLLLLPFFLPIPMISAAATVQEHLRHFLNSIQASSPDGVF